MDVYFFGGGGSGYLWRLKPECLGGVGRGPLQRGGKPGWLRASVIGGGGGG